MSNKYILIAITAVVIAASGIFILAKSRPADIQSNVNTSSASSSLNSVIVKNLQSSSSSSVVVSSSVAVSSIAETPKVETSPVVESKPAVKTPGYVAPQNGNGNEPIKQSAIVNSTYNFNYSFLQVGLTPLTEFDISFLNENIGDVADYYYNSIKPFYPNQSIFINSYGVQKESDLIYYIHFNSTLTKPNADVIASKGFNAKIYKFTRTSLHDGNFEEQSFNVPKPIKNQEENTSVLIDPPFSD
jgi:hypothetical protein